MVDVDGAVLAAEFGAAPDARGAPLVFLHAGVTDSRMWQSQWDRFGAEHPLLRYDRRGFGAARTLQATPHCHVADLLAVMDAVRIDRAVLVGCSQGGRIALDAALARPDRVRALVLVAPSISGAPQPDRPPEVRVLTDAIDAASDAGEVDTVNELEARLWLDGPSAAPGRVAGAARDLFLQMNGLALRAADPGPAIEAPSAWARLAEVAVPVLLIWGDLDLPTIQARCDAALRQLTAARRVVLPGVAHLPPLEDPQRFNAELGSFLEPHAQ
jgi:pimeloyl-ACP methyl ester carboxylesterase